MRTMAECVAVAIEGLTTPAGHGDGLLERLEVRSVLEYVETENAGLELILGLVDPGRMVEHVSVWLICSTLNGPCRGELTTFVESFRRRAGSEDTWRDHVAAEVLDAVVDTLEGEGVVTIDIAVALRILAGRDVCTQFVA